MEAEQLLTCALDIGEQMLISGAEIGRVEDSVRHICTAYGCSRTDVFTITSSIVVSIEDADRKYYTQTRRITATSTDLTRLDKLNALSRRICREKPDYEAVQTDIRRICSGKSYPLWLEALASALIAGSFAVFFGGGLADGLVSALLGCHQMLDGLAELLRGRFTVNTLLNVTFAACCADALFCINELRIPCCAAFSLHVTMALWARYQRRSTETAQMDTLRKAVRLHSLVKEPDCYEGKDAILRGDGRVEDFMDNYDVPSGPEKVQNGYAFLCLFACIGIAVFAGVLHGVSLGVQVFSTCLLVAVPASTFVSLTRPMAVLEKRLHMVGSVLCGWQGVKKLCGKAVFPLRDEDIFPNGSTKLNGVKFYGDRDNVEVVSYATSLICAAGSGLVPVFRQMLTERDGTEYAVENFRNYGDGGIGGEVCGEPVLLGSAQFLKDMGVEIPEGTMVAQAVYAAIDGELCAVFAISYAKMRSASAGLVTLSGYRNLTPVLVGGDFMLTDSLLKAKFGINTRRVAFPDRETRRALVARRPDPENPGLAFATRDELVCYAYAVTGARALRTACRLGLVIHLIGGILGLLIMLVLSYLGASELLTPTHIFLYQLVWMLPGLLVTEWTRTV